MGDRSQPTPAEPRRLGFWLILGVLVYPLLFAWLVLRTDYSPRVREGALLLALFSVVEVLAGIVR